MGQRAAMCRIGADGLRYTHSNGRQLASRMK
jgi:hypothetical protein